MKANDSITKIIHVNKGKNKELNKIYRFVKSCNYFKGDRRKIYSLIVKYKNKGVNK